jgi:hypothetical protein
VVSVSKPVAGVLIGIGAPSGVVAHVATRELPDAQYAIEALDRSRLPEGAKIMGEHK